MSADRGLSTKVSKRAGIHLALGGGAARGLAHIGVLAALEDAGVPIASICGTSMGSLVGAMYALHPDATALRQNFIDFVEGDVYNHARFAFIRAADRMKQDEERSMGLRRWLKHGVLWGRTMAFGSMVPFDEFMTEIKALIPNKRFSDTSLPFYALAVDLTRRKEVVFHEGLLRSAILASSAIPGVFPAIRAGNTVYVDGGWMNKVPVEPLMSLSRGAVLGVDVADGSLPEINAKRGVSLMLQAYAASLQRLQELQMSRAPVIWRPPVQGLHWAEFRQVNEAADIGYEYAQAHMDVIWALVEADRKRGWLDRQMERLSRKRYWKQNYRVPVEWRSIWEISSLD